MILSMQELELPEAQLTSQLQLRTLTLSTRGSSVIRGIWSKSHGWRHEDERIAMHDAAGQPDTVSRALSTAAAKSASP